MSTPVYRGEGVKSVNHTWPRLVVFDTEFHAVIKAVIDTTWGI